MGVTQAVCADSKPLVSIVSLRPFLVALPVIGLTTGVIARLSGHETWAIWVWTLSTLPVLLALLTDIVSSLRRGDIGLDIVAALSMTAALVFGEYLAAAVVALMYAGGQYLERFAERHARREMTALLARVPRTAIVHRNGALDEIDIDAILPGDRLLIRRGDTVPVDGNVAEGLAVLDQSALTGESIPVQLRTAEAVMSGSTNAGDAFDLVATRIAAESTYAGIVRLVEAAQASKAPMARLADSFALVFLAVTVLIAGGAWFWTGDPVRAVAVLVIATPCPLILAVPVALVSGLLRAAMHGILIKGGKPLEMMSRVQSLILDKTGTLTAGHATIVAANVAPGRSENEILRLAASLDQVSKHIIAQTLVAEAQGRQLPLSIPTNTVEVPGEGVEGMVDAQHVVVGGLSFVRSKLAKPAALRKPAMPGAVAVAVAIDGVLAGQFTLADELRDGARDLLLQLRDLGIARVVLATGDRREVAQAIAAKLPLNAVRADLTPDQKVLVVLSERKNGPVMMVGDGVNDAPALAAADVGVAMGAKGAAASAEAADVVLLVDRLDRLLPALRIARRSRAIALQSIYGGIGLSVLGMFAAAFGYITPVQGALIQEVIDVAVILNALRALKDGPAPTGVRPA